MVEGAFKLAKGQYQEALADFNQVLADNPKSIDAYLGIGLVHKEMKNEPEAEKAYKQALVLINESLKEYPTNARLYDKRRQAYQHLGKLDEAAADAKKAASLNSEYSSGESSVDISKLQEKFEESNKISTLLENGKARFQLGDQSGGQKDIEEAISHINVSLQTNPIRGELYFYRGQGNLMLKKYDEATADFKKATELDPQNTAYKTMLDMVGTLQNTDELISQMNKI